MKHSLLPVTKVPKNKPSEKSSVCLPTQIQTPVLCEVLGKKMPDKLVVQHHEFKTLALSGFPMSSLVVWAPAMPRPNTCLVFFG